MTNPSGDLPLETTLDITDDTIEKVDGRTREARAARAAQGDDVQAAAPSARGGRRGPRSTQPRETARSPSRGSAVVQGRNGEELTRKRTSVGDPFHIPDELIEPGWEMQWIAHSVVGNAEVVMDQNLSMLENGWRAVPATRFPGRFMPANATGQIIRGAQGLYERPKQLCEEARAEDVRNAKQLISDRNDALKLSGVKNQLPDGFDMSRRYRGTGGDIRMSIDRNLDIPQPQHQLASSDE